MSTEWEEALGNALNEQIPKSVVSERASPGLWLVYVFCFVGGFGGRAYGGR